MHKRRPRCAYQESILTAKYDSKSQIEYRLTINLCYFLPDELPRSESGRIGINIEGGFGGKRNKARDAYIILLGWFWTVSCVIGTLPLFSMPVYNSVSTFYSRSFVIGPLVRVISRYVTN